MTLGEHLGRDRVERQAREFDLSSPKLIETWARKYRNEGEDGLRPKPAGRPPKPNAVPGEVSELEQRRRENERLRAESLIWEKCGL